MCVSCDKKYRISSYDGNYEEIKKNESSAPLPKISEKKNEINMEVDNIGNKDNKSGKNNEIYKNMNNNEGSKISITDRNTDYLPPLFDLSDAPILDFSTEVSMEDPSSLISKVREIFL